MASIPQDQISRAYYYCRSNPRKMYGFGRGYTLYYDGTHNWTLTHYGTTIYKCNTATGKVTVDGWSVSDVMAINSLAYYTGTKRVYMTNETIYAEGTGPRYEKKKAKKVAAPFGL